VSADPLWAPIHAGSASPAQDSAIFQKSVNALCGVVVGGIATFDAWWVSNNQQWGRTTTSGGVAPQKGPGCSKPSVVVAGHDTVTAGTTFTIDAIVTAGTAPITDESWILDGTPVASASGRFPSATFAASSCPAVTVKLAALDSLGFSSSDQTSIPLRCDSYQSTSSPGGVPDCPEANQYEWYHWDGYEWADFGTVCLDTRIQSPAPLFSMRASTRTRLTGGAR
jgi:hypothetical protein